MSPKTGRPTDDPKRKALNMRVSEATIEKLEYCQNKTGWTKAEIVRQGIEAVYNTLKDTETETKTED